MAMVVSHNMSAANAERQLNATTDNKQKSLEKLSSGYQINRSADDAAGLSISEKMRWQIRGLDKATFNVQDGISLIQTADGALNEVHDILQRMNELATQAANDTYTEVDRQAIQEEINALKKEINRVSDTTTFNTRTILKAKQLVDIDCDDMDHVIMDDTFSGIPNARPTVYGKSLNFSNVNSTNKNDLSGKHFTVTCSDNCSQIFSFSFTDAQSSSATVNGLDLSIEIGMNDATIQSGKDVVDKIYDLVVGQQGTLGFGNGTTDPIYIGHANGISTSGSSLILYSMAHKPPYNPNMGEIHASDLLVKNENLRLQVSAKPYQEIDVEIRTINCTTLELRNLDVSNYASAGASMESIQNAIDKVSDYRSYLGAMQNRLEHTALNNQNTSENTQSTESRLRDTNMAGEMVNYSKLQILQNVNQSMLSQANHQTTDGVLSLLA